MASFALSPGGPEFVHGVGADFRVADYIGAVTTTHINYLTPRVLNIDDLYRSMRKSGIEMSGQIQGPPRWNGLEGLPRQTSVRVFAGPQVSRGRRN
ncbi:2-oxoadipate dioxygenase/decarboxylase family protein [Rhodococcus sp. NPDC060176]|uniref:2-oxoadipate dioxygenase/decarboxylase family protein n=1 Tax=Rhodococcus sp. NPDC060176 TaxID=3347062 RepID=UPI0036515FB6